MKEHLKHEGLTLLPTLDFFLEKKIERYFLKKRRSVMKRRLEHECHKVVNLLKFMFLSTVLSLHTTQC